MQACTFFGHRNCPEAIVPKLREVLIDLITVHGVTRFYVGNQGRFDAYVHSELKKLKQDYPQIQYAVVLAYMPDNKTQCIDYSDTMLPEGIKNVHPRCAISWRNDWMLRKADYVVTYVFRSYGGAAQYANKAIRLGKRVIQI